VNLAILLPEESGVKTTLTLPAWRAVVDSRPRRSDGRHQAEEERACDGSIQKLLA
jgi:hypothetical protein